MRPRCAFQQLVKFTLGSVELTMKLLTFSHLLGNGGRNGLVRTIDHALILPTTNRMSDVPLGPVRARNVDTIQGCMGGGRVDLTAQGLTDSMAGSNVRHHSHANGLHLRRA